MKKSISTLALVLMASIPTVFSQPFKDLIPGAHPNSSTPEQFINVGTKMFFVTATSPGGGAYNNQLWVSDGSVAGTILLKDSLIITNITHPIQLRVGANGTLYFTVGTEGCSSCNMQLWKSDGTPGGTSLITTIAYDIFSGGASPNHFVALGSNCVFSFGNGNGRELWISDGTAGGTTQIIDLAAGGTGGVADESMITYNNNVYFGGSTNGYNTELYSSDGTAGGTTLVKEINPSAFSGSDPGSWIIYNSELYFGADNGSDFGLWKTDGTTPGTVEILTPVDFSNPHIFNSEIYFLGGNAAGILYPLWKTDGTPGGTGLVRDSVGSIHGMNSNYFFTSYWTTSAPYIQIFKRSDGTAAGTVQVPYSIGMSASFEALGDDMYSSHLDSGTANVGVWKTNGTIAGTSMVLAGYGTGPVHEYNNAIWFSNFESGTGYELWTLNGMSGLGELIEENPLHIYPNPTTENVMVEIFGEVNGTIELINMNGAVVFTQQFSQEKMILNVADLVPGIYMVRVTANHGTSVQKLIKN